MGLSEDERLQKAQDRLQKETIYPEGYPEKAKLIQEEYQNRHFSTENPPFNDWEEVGQTASKLASVLSNPKLHDPDGIKKKKYLDLIDRFDIEAGTFREPESTK